MKRPFVTVAVVVLALASSGLFVGSAAAKNRSCGTFRGKGKFHGPPNGPAHLQTWTISGCPACYILSIEADMSHAFDSD